MSAVVSLSCAAENTSARAMSCRAEWLRSILPEVNSEQDLTSRFAKYKKVELHKHLDGCVRHETAWQLSKEKGLCASDVTLAQFKEQCLMQEPGDLTLFLKHFAVFAPAFVGDTSALYRMAYEFCEDCAAENIVYCEARYAPHLLADEALSPTAVVETISKALQDGSRDFKIKVNSILCCMRFRPEWSAEIVQLCDKFRSLGVVGLDLAGDEFMLHETLEGHKLAYKEALRLGVHRTVHAGENGPASVVQVALDELHAERIGHGYHVLEDETLYQRLLAAGVHFETCPVSSLLTGAVPRAAWPHHPLCRT